MNSLYELDIGIKKFNPIIYYLARKFWLWLNLYLFIAELITKYTCCLWEASTWQKICSISVYLLVIVVVVVVVVVHS